MIDGWELDEFEEALEGIILLEREFDNEDTSCELPSWVRFAVEVTDSLSNQMLARTARLHRLTHGFKEEPPPLLIPQRFPRIVLTGGPCSGKSTFMDVVRERFGDTFHCVPEAATIVIAHLGVLPPHPTSHEMAVFQRNLIEVQRVHEEAAELEVRYRGKYGLVLDRGYFDNAAYLRGGRAELRHLMGGATKEAEIMASYDLVLCMAPPPRDVYDRMKATNPARSEPYEEALALSERIVEAWRGHPNFRLIDGANWDDKLQQALNAIQPTLAAYELAGA